MSTARTSSRLGLSPTFITCWTVPAHRRPGCHCCGIGWRSPAVAAGRPRPGRPPENRQLLPPMPGRRRMFAGATVTRHGWISADEPWQQLSQATSVPQKTGRSGPLTFVTVERVVTGPARSVEEVDTIVYKETSGALPPLEPETTNRRWRASASTSAPPSCSGAPRSPITPIASTASTEHSRPSSSQMSPNTGHRTQGCRSRLSYRPGL